MQAGHASRHVVLMREWAKRALDDARGARALVETGERSVALGTAAGRRLLGEDADASAGAAALAAAVREHGMRPVKFVDTFGFSRPVYHPFLVHLHLCGDKSPALREAVASLTLETPRTSDATPLALWWALCLCEAGAPAEAWKIADAIAAFPGEDGTLHQRQGLDDQLDAWTFRELSGLHALAWLAIRAGSEPWWRRVREVAEAHQRITQPDYTTYQPWGVAAFLAFPDTIPFGEQQLHDAVTNLHVERGGAGLVPGLLLADAAAALEAAQGWRTERNV